MIKPHHSQAYKYSGKHVVIDVLDISHSSFIRVNEIVIDWFYLIGFIFLHIEYKNTRKQTSEFDTKFKITQFYKRNFVRNVPN